MCNCFLTFMCDLQLLIQNGAVVSLANKYGETPLNKVKESLQEKLKGEAY